LWMGVLSNLMATLSTLTHAAIFVRADNQA
jgi:hypothetical protein